LDEVKNINQQNKYKKLKELYESDLNIDFCNTLNIDNEYLILIIHPKTNEKIGYHLKNKICTNDVINWSKSDVTNKT